MIPIHKRKLLSIENAKASKSVAHGWLNAIHYMAPADLGGVGNLCPWASEGCKAACLGEYSGKARMQTVKQARRDKAAQFMRHRVKYMQALRLQIEQARLEADFLNLKLAVRLNGSSDVEFRAIYDCMSHIQFVEYTKSYVRMLNWLDGDYPRNVHLTFSRSETNDTDCEQILARGGNVSVVFRKSLPKQFLGYRVVNGDLHDLRHLDPKGERGCIIGLLAKGSEAKRDTSGFVVDGGAL